MVDELRLDSGTASAIVDPTNGGRISSLVVDGHQLLVVDESAASLQWGAYPMVPWAGRVREGRFEFGGIAYQLPCNLPPHSAHGVGFTSAWSLVDDQTITCELGPPWPFGGTVVQRFELNESELLITMTVNAVQDMPVMLGWHPWFVRHMEAGPGRVEAKLSFGNPLMYELDDSAIPTGLLNSPPPGPWDNCFVWLGRNPVIEWPGVVELELSSSCDHWVVYTKPNHALCVEPQSEAPDVFNRAPTVVLAGDSVDAWFRLRWS